MWLTILSDQLPVSALVSRYLTNKLMGREPIPDRRTFGHRDQAVPRPHPVLIHVSMGCPGVGGRLLTRYSPLRRSTRHPKTPFALDLHA